MEHSDQVLKDEAKDNAKEKRIEHIEVRIVENIYRRAARPALAKEFSRETSFAGEDFPKHGSTGTPDHLNQAKPRWEPPRALFGKSSSPGSASLINGLDIRPEGGRRGQIVRSGIVFIETLQDACLIHSIQTVMIRHFGASNRITEYLHVHLNEYTRMTVRAKGAVADKRFPTAMRQECSEVGPRFEVLTKESDGLKGL